VSILRGLRSAVILLLVVAGFAPVANAQIAWKDCLAQRAAWYGSGEAVRVADNVLLYQRRTGGWPKDIDMATLLSADDRTRLAAEKGQTDSTIDNGATYTQMRYLARVFAASRQQRFRAAFLEGFEYLFDAQHPNGGWPQFYPLRDDYSRYITFNDDAMIGVMTLLGDIAAGRAPFGFVDAPRRRRASQAVARGVDVILKTQVRVDGRLTAWCAQHDERTLEPRPARSYEHVSLSGRESVEIVRFLMGIEEPDQQVVVAIESAVTWFRAAQIKGIRVVRRPGPAPGQPDDAVVEKDPTAPPLWARFYQIGTNRPIFSGRDGVVKYSLAEIEYERRANYSWLGSWPARLLTRDYPAWKKRVGK